MSFGITGLRKRSCRLVSGLHLADKDRLLHLDARFRIDEIAHARRRNEQKDAYQIKDPGIGDEASTIMAKERHRQKNQNEQGEGTNLLAHGSIYSIIAERANYCKCRL